MAIELFEMERMQSTWENLVDYDMSESGVRPLTLRELVAMGFDLDEFLDQPLGYSQSNGTIELRERIAAGCEHAGAWLLSDEVYLGAEIARPRTQTFWGMSDRVIVTSGLSKAYGIPGVRIGWIVAPASLTERCWTQHDYLTIGPNKMSDRIARVAVEPSNRERCYARTRQIL